MSTKTERDVAHDEKSNFFIFRPLLAYGMVRNVGVFFLSNIDSKPVKEPFSVTISQVAKICLFKPRHSALKMYLFSLRIAEKPQYKPRIVFTLD